MTLVVLAYHDQGGIIDRGIANVYASHQPVQVSPGSVPSAPQRFLRLLFCRMHRADTLRNARRGWEQQVGHSDLA